MKTSTRGMPVAMRLSRRYHPQSDYSRAFVFAFFQFIILIESARTGRYITTYGIIQRRIRIYEILGRSTNAWTFPASFLFFSNRDGMVSRKLIDKIIKYKKNCLVPGGGGGGGVSWDKIYIEVHGKNWLKRMASLCEQNVL